VQKVKSDSRVCCCSVALAFADFIELGIECMHHNATTTNEAPTTTNERPPQQNHGLHRNKETVPRLFLNFVPRLLRTS